MAAIYYFHPHEPILVIRVTGIVTTEEGIIIFRECENYLEKTGSHHLFRISDLSELVMSDTDFERAIYQAIESYRDRAGFTDPRIVPISVVKNERGKQFVTELKRRTGITFPVFASMPEALEYVRMLIPPA